MKLSFLGLSAAVVVGASTLAATAQDTFTTGAALGRLDPTTGLPSFDPLDNAVLAGGAYTIPGLSPIANAGPQALANVATGTASDLYVSVGTALSGNTAAVTIEFGTWSGSVFTSLWGGGSPMLPSGNLADLMLFDVGNATGTGAPLFPIDGVELGSEWSFSSGTQELYNAAGMFSDTAFTPLPGLPTPVATDFYFAGGFDFNTLNTTDMNKVIWKLDIDLVPAPGAMALLGIAGLAGRRRRR